MKIPYKKIINIRYEMERYPLNCQECPAFIQSSYSCHNEFGLEAHCELGYMKGKDTRDFNGKIRFDKCCIESDHRVFLATKQEDAEKAYIAIKQATERPDEQKFWSFPLEEVSFLLEQIEDGDRENGEEFLLYEGRLYETKETEIW